MMALELPTLYSKNAKEKTIQWTVHTESDVVVMSHGVLGGKMNVTRTRSKPTNVGRSNQRLGPEQALFEAQAAWTKKKDEGYFETIDEAQNVTVYLPMLAHPIVKKTRKKGVIVETRREFSYPCHVQRKLNGLRCLARTKSLLSRQGTVWNIPHIAKHVEMFLSGDNEMLDGEVYIHGVPLQQLNSLIKDNRPESAALTYPVYDFPIICGDECLPWRDRWEMLIRRYSEYELKCRDYKVTPVIKLVETFLVHSEAEIKVLEAQAIAEGYEGLILRSLVGLYRWNTRCDNLLKWKQFTDDEFKVIDMLSRTMIKDGREFEICDKCVCQNNTTDATFKVVPVGSNEQKEEYWKNRDAYIGRRLVVRFLERSMDGIPQGNPVGVAFRSEDDMPNEEPDMWDNKE